MAALVVSRDRLPSVLAAAVAAIAAAAGAVLYLSNVRLLFYPVAMVFLGAIAYLISNAAGGETQSTWLTGMARHRGMDVCILLGIVGTAALARTTAVGLPLAYYVAIAVVVALLAIRILYSPTWHVLVYVVLLGTVIRAAQWYSASVIGRDARQHVVYAEYVANAGNIIPEAVSYYHWYPVTHLLAAAVHLVTGVSPKTALFLGAGVPPVIAVVGIYLLTHLVLADTDESARQRAALFAALLVIVSPWHIARTAGPIAQSLNLAFVPLALYLAIRPERRKVMVLFLGTLTIIAFTHNLTPLVLLVVFAFFLLVQGVLSRLQFVLPTRPNFSYVAVVVVGILITQYWMYIQYFRLQANRVVRLLNPGGSVESAVKESSVVSEYAISLQDPVLHVGFELLLYIALFVLVAHFVVGELLRREPFPLQWIVVAALFFGWVSVSHFFGRGTRIVRAFPNIVLIVAPVFGYLVSRTWRSRGGKVVVLAILLLLPTNAVIAASYGVTNPAISGTDNEIGGRFHLTGPEVAGAEHAVRYSRKPVYTDRYVSTTLRRRALGEGVVTLDEREVRGMRRLGADTALFHVDAEMLRRYGVIGQYSDGSTPVLYRPYVRPFANTSLDVRCSVVYDSDAAKLLSC